MVVLVGLDILSRANQSNSAVVFIDVKPWDQRGPQESIEAITGRINGRLFGMQDAIAFAFNLPEIIGLGTTAGVETNVQARAGQSVQDFSGQVQAFTQATDPLPGKPGSSANFRANLPPLYVDPDRANA